MDLVRGNGVDYIFGLGGTRCWIGGRTAADDVRVSRAEGEAPVVRRYRRDPLRRQVLEVRAPRRRPHRGHRNGLDIRYVVTKSRAAAPSGSTTRSIASAARPRT